MRSQRKEWERHLGLGLEGVAPGRWYRESFALIGCAGSSRGGPRAETDCSGLLEAQRAEAEGGRAQEHALVQSHKH